MNTPNPSEAREIAKLVSDADIDALAIRFEDCWRSCDTRTAIREVILPWIEQHATPSSATSEAVAQWQYFAVAAQQWINLSEAGSKIFQRDGFEIRALYLHPHPIERQAVTDEMVERACDAFAPLNMNDGRPLDLWPTLTREYLRKNVRAALEAALNG